MENSRRDMMAGACAVAAMTFAPAALAAWEPSQRYPDPAIQTLDPSFNKYRLALAGVERLARGCRFNEGAVYFGDARCLLWSDIPNNRIMRWDEETGRISILPPALQSCQRQHPRPPGPTHHLRAFRPSHHTHRV